MTKAKNTLVKQIKIALVVHNILMISLLVYGYITYSSVVQFGQSITLWLVLGVMTVHWIIIVAKYRINKLTETNQVTNG